MTGAPIESRPKFSYKGTRTFPYSARARSRIRHSAKTTRTHVQATGARAAEANQILDAAESDRDSG